MFTIQYEIVSGAHKMLSLDTKSRERLVSHLAQFQYPIMAVYEQATPITKTARKLLAEHKGTLSRYAREFAFAMTPA